MASCSSHKGGRCSCAAPASVTVGGHWREVKPRRKKRAAPAKPKGTYYVAEDTTGRKCDHHHRTRSGARRCANALQRKEVVYRARYLTRKQARTTRVRRWDVSAVKG
jgi:hypothetical protein